MSLSDRRNEPEPDFLIDTGELNSRLAQRAENPLRWKVATFTIPADASPSVRRSIAQLAIDTWVERMARTGWQLTNKPELYGPFPAYWLEDNRPKLGFREYRIKAVFKLTKTPQRVRIELPRDSIRQDPEHKLSRHEAAKILGYDKE